MTASPPSVKTLGRPHVLLCSGWQSCNIGDMAHTPAALTLLARHFPEAQVTLWPFKPLAPGAGASWQKRFPSLHILNAHDADHPDTQAAMDAADFFLHSSGPAMLGWPHAEAFRERTGRPFGVYGITYGLYGIPEKATLSRARFVYFRDTPSLECARREGVDAPIMEWSPDVAFAADGEDDAAAEAFLRAHSLNDGAFLCCIPRLRSTPFWKMPGHDAPFDAARHARNEALKEHDHAPLRAAIIAVTRQTDLNVLLCPEDESQVELGRQLLLEPLPEDVKRRVVWRDRFWSSEEALSVYRRAAGVFGCEMHSPIMGVGNGIPAIVCRFAEQSTKGLMWRDIGLGKWLFDLDNEADLPRIAPAVLALAQNPAAARARAQTARTQVFGRLAETMAVVRREVLAAHRARQST